MSDFKLVILDRDGVINYDSEFYIKSPAEWHEIPGSLAAIARLNQAGFKVAVASNQSGVSRGYYTAATLAAIHDKMIAQLAQHGGVIDKIVYCPHLPTAGCDCRKPKTGLLKQIAEYFQCSLVGVPFIGDRGSDIEAASAVGALPILIDVDERQLEYQAEYKVLQFKNLSTAVDAILAGNL